MEITIDEIFEDEIKGDELYVKAITPYGTIIGIWCEQNPEINQKYLIEIDIPKTLSWGKDIVISDDKLHRIINGEHEVIFKTRLEEVDKDNNCASVRLGDHFILIETIGTPIEQGSYITIRAPEVLLYPYANLY